MLDAVFNHFMNEGIIMKKIVLSVFFVAVIVAGVGAYWYGNQPKMTYYPNGEVKTSIQQEFFKEKGEYKVFNQDGTLAQKYIVDNGVRIGKGFVYASGVVAEFNYENGSLSGPLKFDTKGKVPELDNLQIDLTNSGYVLEYKQQKTSADTTKKEDLSVPDTKITGKIVCTDDEFLNNMQAFLDNQTLDTFKNFAKCISINTSSFEDELYKCEYEGVYVYPSFTADSKFTCDSKGINDMVAASFMQAGIPDIGKVSASLSYVNADKKFLFDISDDNGVYNQVQTFKGLEDMISFAVEYTFSKQDSKDTIKFVSDVLKSFIASDSQLTIGGKVVSAVKGDFNFINGFSDSWTASFFGIENTLTSQIKISDKGLVMNIAYPISKKPLLSVGIQVNDKFKQKYKSAIELVMKEFSENSEDVASEHIMAKLPEYSMSFSDVINSVNALLMNNKGEKVVGAVFNVKKGMDFITAAGDLQNAFTAKIISYKNNKPYKVISGDAENGFVADGKIIPVEDIADYFDKDALDDISKQVEAEYSEVYKMMKDNKYPSDPFIRGFYEGYYNAMQQYKSTQDVEQVNKLIENLRVVYADTANYGNLNNELAINLNTIPKEMIAENGKIISATGGEVNIYAVPAFAGDTENLSFVVQIADVPQATCMNLVTDEWGENTGIIAIGVNQNVADLPLDASQNDESEQCLNEGVLCAAEQLMDIIEASKACKDDGNMIYFKVQ